MIKTIITQLDSSFVFFVPESHLHHHLLFRQLVGVQLLLLFLLLLLISFLSLLLLCLHLLIILLLNWLLLILLSLLFIIKSIDFFFLSTHYSSIINTNILPLHQFHQLILFLLILSLSQLLVNQCTDLAWYAFQWHVLYLHAHP